VASLIVFVGVVLEATVATHVPISDSSTVNELLLRERLKLSGGNEVGTFKGSSGGEGPA